MMEAKPITNPDQFPLPPLAPGLPLVGNALSMARDPSKFFVRSYRAHGPIFRIRILTQPYTVLAGPEANRFMARQGAAFLRSREFWSGLLEEFGAQKGLIATDGEVHARLRGVMRRGYSRGSLRGRYPQLIEITKRMIEDEWKPGESISVVRAMQQLAAEQLGIMAAGQPPGEYVDDLRTFIRTILNVRVTKQRPRLLLQLPAYRRAKRRVYALGQSMIDAYDPSSVDPENATVIDDIMAAAQEDPDLFPKQELMMAILGPYFAGLDTVANTLAAMLYSVLKEPGLEQILRAEADQLFASGITESSIRSMKQMRATFFETLRRYPIAVAAMRNATQDFEFGGYRVEEGQTLYMATAVSHFLPEFYSDPYRFDIARTQSPRNEHRQADAFAPFGLGSHTCLGAGMAEMQIMLNIAALLHHRKMELLPPDYELRLSVAPVPGPEAGFKIRVLGSHQVE